MKNNVTNDCCLSEYLKSFYAQVELIETKMAIETGSTWYKSQSSHFFSLVGDILFSKQNTQTEWPPGEGPYILQKWYSPNFLVEAVEAPT